MAIVSELRLTVTRRLNLGNYEHVEINANAVVSRDSDSDTVEDLRNKLLDEIAELMAAAISEYVPKKRQQSTRRED